MAPLKLQAPPNSSPAVRVFYECLNAACVNPSFTAMEPHMDPSYVLVVRPTSLGRPDGDASTQKQLIES